MRELHHNHVLRRLGLRWLGGAGALALLAGFLGAAGAVGISGTALADTPTYDLTCSVPVVGTVTITAVTDGTATPSSVASGGTVGLSGLEDVLTVPKSLISEADSLGYGGKSLTLTAKQPIDLTGATQASVTDTFTGTGTIPATAAPLTITMSPSAAVSVTAGTGSQVVFTIPEATSSQPLPVTIDLGGTNLSSSCTTSSSEQISSATIQAVSSAPPVFHSISPVRICDTRSLSPSDVTSGVTGQCDNSGNIVTSAGPLVVKVAGLGGIPSEAAESVSAVVLNVTAVGESGSGYLTVYPTGSAAPATSNVNFTKNDTVANLTEVGLPSSGSVTIAVGPSGVSSNVVVDVEGYYAAASSAGGGTYEPISPARIVDTRCSASPAPSFCSNEHLPSNDAKVPLQANTPEAVQVTGDGGIPSSGVSAVVLNLTAVDYSADGYLTAYPESSGPAPVVSNVNFSVGQGPVPNRVIVQVSSTGAIDVVSNVGSDFIVDVNGYFTSSGTSGSVLTAESEPVRILDTRCAVSPVPSFCSNEDIPSVNSTIGMVGGGKSITVHVVGTAGLPTAASAAVANVTVTGGSVGGYLTVYPGSGSPPVISDLNWVSGETVANLAVADLSSSGTITIYNGSTAPVNVIVDVMGWYQPGS